MFNSKQNFYLIDAANITTKAESVDQITGKKLIATEKGETVKDLMFPLSILMVMSCRVLLIEGLI